MKNWVVLIFGVFLVVGACSPGGGGGSDADSGQPTAKWFISKGAPSNSEGVDGDLYLDQDAAILYVKTGGQWVTAVSLRGPAGTGWLFGAGTPGPALGANGDMYLDTNTTMTYQKQNGVWVSKVDLHGTDWYTGTATPTPSMPTAAQNGDFYFQTSTGVVYKKDSSGNWSSFIILSFNPASFVFTPHMESAGMDSIYAVAFGNGIYVGVGDDGLIVRSTDGTNWQVANWTEISTARISKGLQTPPVGYPSIEDTLIDVAFGNGMFVALGTYASYVSTDGINWAESNSGTLTSLVNSIAFLNGKFYITGNDSDEIPCILSSADGMNWDFIVSEKYGDFVFPAYGNGKYIVLYVGEGLSIYTSMDGVSWENAGIFGIDSMDTIYSIVFGSGFFVAVGVDLDANENERGAIWLSTDGIHWTTQDLPTDSQTVFWDAAYGSNGFAVVGSNYNSYRSIILTSPNGIAWNVEGWDYSGGFTGVAPATPGTFVVAKANMPS